MPKTTGSMTMGPSGPAGVTGVVGSTYYNTTTGTLSVYSGNSTWVTAANTGATGPSWNVDDYSGNDITIRRKGKQDIAVGKTLDTIMERLCIIEPSFEKLEKYPALKEAYENYKLIEAMLMNDQGNDDE